MLSRFWVFFILLALLFTSLFVQSSFAKSGLPKVRIGIVADGPYQDYGWGKIVKSKLFLKEILELTRGEYDVIFPKNKFLHGNWSVKDIHRAVNYLLADTSVDLIIAMGVLASHDLSRRPFLSKPAVAPFVIDVQMQGLPFSRGTSGVRNLSYLSLPHSFERAVKAYKEILSFSKMTLFIDQTVFDALPQLRRKILRAAKDNDLEINAIPVETYIQPALAAIPDDTEAVFVTPLLRLPLSEFKALTQGLVDRKLPSFSLFGREEVEYGLLASIAPETNTLRLARRVALNIHRILLGEDAGTFFVSLPEAERLTINMATARAIETWPTFRVLTEADLINEDVEFVKRRLSLYSVVREAVSVNLDLAAADRRVASVRGGPRVLLCHASRCRAAGRRRRARAGRSAAESACPTSSWLTWAVRRSPSSSPRECSTDA